jgi:hypothetical protein
VSGFVVEWEHFGSRGPGVFVGISMGCGLGIIDITHAPGVPIEAQVQVCGWGGTDNGLDEIVNEPSAAGTPGPEVTVVDNGPFSSPVSRPARATWRWSGTPGVR